MSAAPEEVEPILRARITEAMFPLSNLRRYGAEGHPRSMRFWRSGDAVLGLSAEGVAFPLFPDGFDARPSRELLARIRLRGLIGPEASVAALVKALSLRVALREPEPQFTLSLTDLVCAEGEGELVPLQDHVSLAAAWRQAFQTELNVPADPPAEVQVAQWCAEDTHRLWCVGGVPVALTGVNASLPEIVQVGAVYVPNERRGMGYARQAVGAHLSVLRDAGVRHATLCAASVAAARSYMALGFRRIGCYSTTVFPTPVEVAP
ncbi:GNAT family N-acetyltransferase [Palleronia sp.]|uniref:GNAT family N-acetyltransferase n=1 Tax=Palleronia sp. TaxID=1940284 RepID=UPI0035C87154